MANEASSSVVTPKFIVPSTRVETSKVVVPSVRVR